MDFMGGEARIRALVAFAVAFEATTVACATGLWLGLRGMITAGVRSVSLKWPKVARMRNDEVPIISRRLLDQFSSAYPTKDK